MSSADHVDLERSSRFTCAIKTSKYDDRSRLAVSSWKSFRGITQHFHGIVTGVETWTNDASVLFFFFLSRYFHG